jgi:hypothetical protein
MARENKTDKRIKTVIIDLINKCKLISLSYKNEQHSHAVFTLVTLLHEAGYPVNWDTNHLRSFAFRNKDLPLYIRQTKRYNNKIRADVVFALDDKTLVALEITTWKRKLSKKTREALEKALMREKEVREDGKSQA